MLSLSFRPPIGAGTDEKLSKAVGKSFNSSGMGFGIRDISWDFKTQKKAFEAYNILTSLNGIENVQMNKEEW